MQRRSHGVYPTSHFNPGATDSVLHAGPVNGTTLTEGVDVRSVPNVMVSNPAVKELGSDTVAFASGTLGILKLLVSGQALEAVILHGLSRPGGSGDESQPAGRRGAVRAGRYGAAGAR